MPFSQILHAAPYLRRRNESSCQGQCHALVPTIILGPRVAGLRARRLRTLRLDDRDASEACLASHVQARDPHDPARRSRILAASVP